MQGGSVIGERIWMKATGRRVGGFLAGSGCTLTSSLLVSLSVGVMFHLISRRRRAELSDRVLTQLMPGIAEVLVVEWSFPPRISPARFVLILTARKLMMTVDKTRHTPPLTSLHKEDTMILPFGSLIPFGPLY
jgi:hypothetical protein